MRLVFKELKTCCLENVISRGIRGTWYTRHVVYEARVLCSFSPTCKCELHDASDISLGYTRQCFLYDLDILGASIGSVELCTSFIEQN